MDPLLDDYLDALLEQKMLRHMFQSCQRVPTLLMYKMIHGILIGIKKGLNFDFRVIIEVFLQQKNYTSCFSSFNRNRSKYHKIAKFISSSSA
jgi:hypothetical protein